MAAYSIHFGRVTNCLLTRCKNNFSRLCHDNITGRCISMQKVFPTASTNFGVSYRASLYKGIAKVSKNACQDRVLLAPYNDTQL